MRVRRTECIENLGTVHNRGTNM